MHHPAIIRDLNDRKVSSPTVDQVVDKALEAFSDQQLFRALVHRGAVGIVASLSETKSDAGPSVLIDDCVVVNLDAFKDAASRCIDEDEGMKKSIIAALEDAENAAEECPCPNCTKQRDAGEAVEEAMRSVDAAKRVTEKVHPALGAVFETVRRLHTVPFTEPTVTVLERVVDELVIAALQLEAFAKDCGVGDKVEDRMRRLLGVYSADDAAARVYGAIPGWAEAMATIGRLDPIDRGDLVAGVLETVAAKLEEIATRGETTKH